MYLIIDSNAICHRAKHAMKRIELSHEEMKTEIIFVFLSNILMYAKKFQTSDFIFTWDSRKNYRKELYPGYKKREEEEADKEEQEINEIAFKQFSTLRRKVLPALGFKNVFIQSGMEADDIIAMITIWGGPTQFTIVSSDSDLYQLLNACVSMYLLHNKKVYTKLDFIKKYKITTSQWYLVKALAGCVSDKVKGIEGIGDKSVCDYLNGELKGVRKEKLLAEKDEMLKKNVPLVKLPFKGTKHFKIQKNKLYKRDFLRVFEDYNFKSFLYSGKFKEWIEYLELR